MADDGAVDVDGEYRWTDEDVTIVHIDPEISTGTGHLSTLNGVSRG